MHLPANRPKLGQRVRFTARLRRVDLPDGTLQWTAQPINPGTGYYIGVRVLSNGFVRGRGSEDGTEYIHQESVVAFMVVFAERQSPILCLPIHVGVL